MDALFHTWRSLLLLGALTLLGGCQQSSVPESNNPASDPGVVELAADNQAAGAEPAAAPVVKVVTSGGFAAAYDLLQGQIEDDLGINLHTSYGSSSGGALDSIPVRLEKGEQFDVIILSRSSLDRLTDKGEVMAESRTDLVHSKIGMAVREGAAVPDISTAEKFVAALKAADSIGYSASASGTYLSTRLWPEMGLWDAIGHKSKRILSERVAAVVARGEVEIGFQQISEILPIEGVDYAGSIPEELQKVTTFSSGILHRAENPGDAARLISYLSSAELAPQIAETGLTPVVTLSSDKQESDEERALLLESTDSEPLSVGL